MNYMNIIKATDSIRVFQDSSYYLVNSICVNLDSELLFIDTGMNPTVANKFRSKMHQEFQQRKGSLTITHANSDHYMGLEAFMDLPIVVSDKFMKHFQNRVKSINNKSIQSFKPTKTYESTTRFGSGENHITFTLSGGHTDDSSYGYYSTEKVLIAGDNIVTDMPQFFLHPDSNLEKFIKCLKKWKQMEIDIVIPGHGNITTPSHIIRVLDYAEDLYEFLLKSKEKNYRIDEILDHKDLPKYFEPDPNNWIPSGIKQIYKNLKI